MDRFLSLYRHFPWLPWKIWRMLTSIWPWSTKTDLKCWATFKATQTIRALRPRAKLVSDETLSWCYLQFVSNFLATIFSAAKTLSTRFLPKKSNLLFLSFQRQTGSDGGKYKRINGGFSSDRRPERPRSSSVRISGKQTNFPQYEQT